MDQNELRTIGTVVMFISFIGIVGWAWGKGRKQAFDEAAAIPFTEDDEPNKGKNHE